MLERRQRSDQSELVPFGETVAGHFPQKHRKNMESGWHLGIWVGRTITSNEHILLTQGVVLRCRSVRRLELEERHIKKIMESAKGVPWDQRPPEIIQTEDHSKNEIHYVEPLNRLMSCL